MPFASPIEAYENGKLEEAIDQLCAGGVEPFSQEAKILRTCIRMAHEDFASATEILDTCAPEDTQVQKLLGHIAFQEDRFDDAVGHYEFALALNPSNATAAHDLGAVYSHLQQHAKALHYMNRAVEIRPDWPQARMSRGIIKLNACDESGFVDYEARHDARPGEKVHYDKPHWEGESVAGKRFFLLCEQGFGDQLQFMRYAKILADMGARVLVGVHEKLRRIAQLQAGVSEAYAFGGQVAPFDVWAYSMSMPRVLRGMASMGPATMRLRRRTRGGKGYVGLAWKGNPAFKGERFRRIPVRAFEPILRDHKCVRMQFELADGEPGTELPDATSGCFDHLDSAMRMLDELDALVTSDCGLGHLAGSIGIPTVLCLPEVMDFRWKVVPPSFYYPETTWVVNSTNWDETIATANSYLKDILR